VALALNLPAAGRMVTLPVRALRPGTASWTRSYLMTTKDYTAAGIIVHWDGQKCQHSGRCVAGSPQVFHPSQRPWITPEAQDADGLAATIDTCPSGALSYTRTAG
jgi:uncharacterized Fe-S cluster protein YjdI